MAAIKAPDREGLDRVGLLTTDIFLWVSSTRFGVIPLMCKEGTKRPHFPALSQERDHNPKHYSMFPCSGVRQGCTRTVEHCPPCHSPRTLLSTGTFPKGANVSELLVSFFFR